MSWLEDRAKPDANPIFAKFPYLRDLPKLPAAVINDTVTDPAILQGSRAAIGSVVPVVYGRVRIGGLIFAAGHIGSDLVLGAAWAIGPVQAVESVTINDESVPAAVTVTTYTGSSTQTTDATLAAAIAGFGDPMVAYTDAAVPVAYSVFRVPRDAVSGFPRLDAVIHGRKVYDPRTPATVYSRNPALCLADWLVSTSYGQGVDSINWDSVGNAADACDEVLSDSTTRRVLDLAVAAQRPVSQWTDVLRAYAGCFVAQTGSDVQLIPDRPVTLASSRSVTASDMIEGSVSLERLSTRARPSVVTVSYTDTSTLPWRLLSVPAVDYAAVGGAWREERVQMQGVTSRAQAYREAVERLNAAKYADLVVTYDSFDAAIQDTIGDVVKVTHPVGLTDEPMRITDVQIISPGRWRVTAGSYNTLTYSDEINPPWTGDYTSLPAIEDIPAVDGLTIESGTDHLLLSTDGTILSRMHVTWTAVTYPYLDRVQVEYKRVDDTDYQVVEGLESVYCSPVQDGVSYDVRVRIRNAFGISGDWVTTQHTVVGKTEPPEPPVNFFITTDPDGSRRFSWGAPFPDVPLDLAGYKIRYKLGTGQLWDDMADLHSGIISASPYETNQLSAGAYTFAIASVDTTGNVSSKVYIEGTLPDPRLAGTLDYFDPAAEGWPGTITDGWIDPYTNHLLATDTKDWSDFATDTVDWAAWQEYARDANDLVYQYSDIDIGTIVQYTPLITVSVIDGTPTIEIATSDDGTSWSAWTTSLDPVTSRYLRVRVTVTGSAGQIIGLEPSMQILLDAKPVEEIINDLDTSTLTGSYRIGTGDIRLPITETYAIVRYVFVTLQNVGSGWTWELIDKDTTTGPRIKIYDNTGTLADATIDAQVQGL